MKAFKYLVFLILLTISSFSNALTLYKWNDPSYTKWDTSLNEACINGAKAYLPPPARFIKVNNAGPSGAVYSCSFQFEQSGNVGSTAIYIITKEEVCPSATTKDLKVPVNSKSYVCVQGCQYRLRACVDVDMEPGMTCTAISTGQDCGTTPPPKEPDPNKPDATPDPSDPTPDKTNTATTNGTSTSTSTTTTNNDGTSTSTTTVTNTTTTNNTTINLDGLENTMKNLVGVISNKLDEILGKMGNGDGGNDGGGDGQGNGEGEGIDLTETNGILSEIKDWLTGEADTSEFDAEVPTRELTQQSFSTSIFGGSAACPADRTLNMTLFTGRSFSKEFSFSMWCDKLAIFGYLILVAAYMYAAVIVVRNS